MATSFPDYATGPQPEGPAWASWLGVITIVFGIFLTASHGNEWMKQAVITHSMPASGEMPAADCPPEELEEEGLTLAECEHMVANVKGIALSAPGWFSGFQTVLSATGTVIAFLSIIVGAALVNYRSLAPTVAILTFAALIAIDVIGFIGTVNAGPILRQIYLSNILLWFFIHLIMIAGVVGGRCGKRSTT
jgi:hypothetical protein